MVASCLSHLLAVCPRAVRGSPHSTADVETGSETVERTLSSRQAECGGGCKPHGAAAAFMVAAEGEASPLPVATLTCPQLELLQVLQIKVFKLITGSPVAYGVKPKYCI